MWLRRDEGKSAWILEILRVKADRKLWLPGDEEGRSERHPGSGFDGGTTHWL